MDIEIYAFYNNKGGVGKTTLCSNAATLYAKDNPDTHQSSTPSLMNLRKSDRTDGVRVRSRLDFR